MSNFSRKFLSGEIPTDTEWMEHLIEAHRDAPSMTPAAFARYRTSAGINSYEMLAETLSGQSSLNVLDLACGDGHLVRSLLPKMTDRDRVTGVDMSEGELAVARRSYEDPRVSFVNAKAQELPFENETVDVVLCHMAFMLMKPVEPVVAEIARVLKKGGVFAAVVPGSRENPGFNGEIRRFIFQFIRSRYPVIDQVKSGDARTLSKEGVQSLFSAELGFSKEIEVEDFALQMTDDPAGVWEMTKDMYFIGMLPSSEREQLRKELSDFVRERTDAKGQVSFEFPLKRIKVVKKV